MHRYYQVAGSTGRIHGSLAEDADFSKNIIFSDKAHYDKEAKLSNLGHRKHARIHLKADAPKTSHCLVRIMVQGHNWVIFLRK